MPLPTVVNWLWARFPPPATVPNWSVTRLLVSKSLASEGPPPEIVAKFARARLRKPPAIVACWTWISLLRPPLMAKYCEPMIPGPFVPRTLLMPPAMVPSVECKQLPSPPRMAAPAAPERMKLRGLPIVIVGAPKVWSTRRPRTPLACSSTAPVGLPNQPLATMLPNVFFAPEKVLFEPRRGTFVESDDARAAC